MMAGELQGAHPLRQVFHLQLIRQAEERTSHLLLSGKAVHHAFGQGMPDRDEQLPSNGYPGLLLGRLAAEPFVFRLPMVVAADGRLGRLDHHPPQVAPAHLGNLAPPLQLAAVMSFCT